MSYYVCMTDERAQYVVIMQTPVHYADYICIMLFGNNLTIVVALGGTKYRLVVMCEAHQIDTIALTVVSVHLPKALNQVKKSTYSPLSKSYRLTELSSHPATKYLPS